MKNKLLFLYVFINFFMNAQSPIYADIKETNFFPGSEANGLLQVDENIIFSANTGRNIKPHKYNLLTGKSEVFNNISQTT